ncbi:TPA: hypothetical protein ACWX81_000693 [Pseudomonas aeruginosa]|uniref:Uncharacterized protein n=1 Tax=Pseudomonas phage vB_PaeP_E220 TaxID=2034343 RepID=A0A2K8HZX9_9CAUD|nr:hypothetical protein [Pseudomonas aeruginosa]YP_010765819.1 hypothetical protein QGM56_gp60 [Pseudomonas phage vB_PaeP_E220]ASZ72200.1 hypothetical protein vBPaePE220_00060 [Pseudomonas phage vB_PaeP_E220]MBA5358433.1 hypothetical protein [Pseudomonas aeruginosa]MBO2823303.1 hypothetical protein [Pseudomonas aeruginosa]MDI4207433.1 hypothetical protein [Pseudomonas aeruginosa]RLR55500.1 hypothetical protein CKA45_07435 [Pseudomonas aeruginosa]
MTILKNVDLDNGTVEVTEYSATNAALAQLRVKYAEVPDANTEEGYAFIKDGIKELTSLRTSLEAARKREKAPYLQAGQIIDAEAKRITAELAALEDPMKAAKKVVDDRVERERRERIARLQQKVDAIKAMPAQVRGQSSDDISAMLDRVGEIDATHDFYDLTKEAVEARQAALEELTQMLTDRLAFEQAERQRQELEAQQAEMRRRMEEQDAEMRRQQEEMQRQREELARQQRELAAARQQLAEQETPAAVDPEAPKVEAAPAPAQIKPASKAAEPSATQWRARVVDKTALIAAIAEGLATEDLLVVDQPALDSLANSKGQTLNLPGVIVEKSPAKAA